MNLKTLFLAGAAALVVGLAADTALVAAGFDHELAALSAVLIGAILAASVANIVRPVGVVVMRIGDVRLVELSLGVWHVDGQLFGNFEDAERAFMSKATGLICFS